MDIAYISFTLGRLGVKADALTDGVARVKAHLQDHDETPEAVDRFCQTLQQDAPHLFEVRQPAPTKAKVLPPADWPVTERMTYYRLHNASEVQPRRQERLEAPADLTTEWNKLPPIPRLTAQREWAAAQRQASSG